MGTDRTDYVVEGILILDEQMNELSENYDTDKYYDNAYKDEIGSHNELSIIEDGMSGNYNFICRILSKVSDGYIGGDEIVDITQLSNPIKTAALISAEFEIKEPNVRLYVFSHYH